MAIPTHIAASLVQSTQGQPPVKLLWHTFLMASVTFRIVASPFTRAGTVTLASTVAKLTNRKQALCKTCGLCHNLAFSFIYSLSETACIWCLKAHKQGDNHFCGTACADEAKKKGPCIINIPDDHVTFQSGMLFQVVCSIFKRSTHTNICS